ncbi:DUF6916 family protein [Bradyrhizobium erythrophlei]|uniref:DUF6916 family protein n=1 Tax=Bradyrhizobium erythrophlei TaxID=1437360 RepID=UPI0035E6800A
MASSVDLATLHIDDFTAHKDAAFDMQTANGVVPLRLAKVDAAGNSGRQGGAFSLLFAAPKGPWLPQAIYPVTHPRLGTMEIFLVPIGPLADGNGYQAIFT